MGAGCQRNRPVMGVGRGEEVCRKGYPYNRQLANNVNMTKTTDHSSYRPSYNLVNVIAAKSWIHV